MKVKKWKPTKDMTVEEKTEGFFKRFYEFYAKRHNYDHEYDFSEARYIGSEIPMTVICKEHGKFTVTPHTLIRGGGCRRCQTQFKIQMRDSKAYFEKANKKHNFKYDYSNSVYRGIQSMITYKCPLHGEVTQRADGHLLYTGCLQCMAESRRHTTDDFIKLGRRNFGDKYDYSKTVYTKNNEPVIITCPEHGDFTMIAGDHMRAKERATGCPVCNGSKPEQETWDILHKRGVAIIPQYRFKDTKYFYDFYLPDMNILIEYNGIQHYEDVKSWARNGINYLENRKKLDREKVALAKKLKIPLYIIKYDVPDLDKAVDAILDKEKKNKASSE